MKTKLIQYLLVLTFLFITQIFYSQCDNSLPFRENCEDAIVICDLSLISEELFCLPESDGTGEAFGSACGIGFHNPLWINFVAQSERIEFLIEIFNATTVMGNNGTEYRGLQVGVLDPCEYGSCYGWTDSCNEDAFVFETTDLIIGKVYQILLDGCFGSQCDFRISATYLESSEGLSNNEKSSIEILKEGCLINDLVEEFNVGDLLTFSNHNQEDIHNTSSCWSIEITEDLNILNESQNCGLNNEIECEESIKSCGSLEIEFLNPGSYQICNEVLINNCGAFTRQTCRDIKIVEQGIQNHGLSPVTNEGSICLNSKNNFSCQTTCPLTRGTFVEVITDENSESLIIDFHTQFDSIEIVVYKDGCANEFVSYNRLIGLTNILIEIDSVEANSSYWVEVLWPLPDLVDFTLCVETRSSNNIFEPTKYNFVFKDAFGEPVDNVEIFVRDEDTNNDLVYDLGYLEQFEFVDEFQGISNPVFSFEKNDEIVKGINAIDLIVIQKHILDIKKITDLDLILAGDANNDGILTSVDLIILQKLILDIRDSFPDNADAWICKQNGISISASPGSCIDIEVEFIKRGDVKN